MYATNFALQKLMSEGKLHPDDRIAKYIPGFADSPNDTIKGKNTLRISDLLHHSGGFPADPQYPNKAVAGALYSRDKGQTLEMIKRTPLEYQPGSKHIYSDVDYMLLGFIVESVTGQPLDRYVEESIYRPLGLTHTVFNPLLKGFKPQQIAATELNGNTRDGVIHFPNIRTSTLWGQVHDEKPLFDGRRFRARRFVFQYRRYCGVNANDAERRGLWRCAAVQCGNGEDVHHQL